MVELGPKSPAANVYEHINWRGTMVCSMRDMVMDEAHIIGVTQLN